MTTINYIQTKVHEISFFKTRIINDWMIAQNADPDMHMLLSIRGETLTSTIEEHFVLVPRHEVETPYIDLQRLTKQYPNLHIGILVHFAGRDNHGAEDSRLSSQGS